MEYDFKTPLLILLILVLWFVGSVLAAYNHPLWLPVGVAGYALFMYLFRK